MAQTENESKAALLGALAGEIGNNCFDHNLGQWRDLPGCWFDYGLEGPLAWTVIADRGQGVLASLRRADSHLENDQQAIEAAFHRRLSGRSPEKRGNGLQFVRNLINGDRSRRLFFISGRGRAAFGGLSSQVEQFAYADKTEAVVSGTLALVLWSQGS